MELSYTELILNRLKERKVELKDIVQLTYDNQCQYEPEITKKDVEKAVLAVLDRTETQNAIFVGLELDRLAELNLLKEPLLSIIKADQSTFGIDETLALSILNTSGSIAWTNYGYMDRAKTGIIDKIDKEGKATVHTTTFLDDLIGAIAASAAGKLAHRLNKDSRSITVGD